MVSVIQTAAFALKNLLTTLERKIKQITLKTCLFYERKKKAIHTQSHHVETNRLERNDDKAKKGQKKV